MFITAFKWLSSSNCKIHYFVEHSNTKIMDEHCIIKLNISQTETVKIDINVPTVQIFTAYPERIHQKIYGFYLHKFVTSRSSTLKAKEPVVSVLQINVFYRSKDSSLLEILDRCLEKMVPIFLSG